MNVRFCEREGALNGPATDPPASGQLPDIRTTLTEHERLLRVSLYATLARAVERLVARDNAPGNPSRIKFTCRSSEVRLERTAAPAVPRLPEVPRVLDVGCGRGELLRHLCRRGYRANGLDREPECVRVASRYAPCRIGPGEDVEQFFTRGEFDCIVSSHVLEHLPDPLRLLEALRRMEARAYVFAVPNLLRPARLVRALLGSARPDHPAHLLSWGRPEFQALLGRAGFRVTDWLCDRVTVHPLCGRAGACLSRVLSPLETRLLPRLFPLLSSSLIVACVIDREGNEP